MFFNKFDVKIEKTDSRYRLNAKVHGEKIDRKKHKIKTEVKAVSYSQMDIYRKDGKWMIKVILDV